MYRPPFSFHASRPLRHPPPFPTRRSSDLVRLDTDASALESLLLESGTVTMGEDVDPADVADAQAYIEEPGTKDPEVETLITGIRSEEHTSELESRFDLVCRLLLAKKKTSV